MRKNNVLVIILTVLIFLSGTLLGVSTVYRVEEVSVDASLVSTAAQAETEELKTRLQETYKTESMFAVEEEKAKALVAEYPYFRYVSFQRDYPNRLVVKISEDAEVYAVACMENVGSYYILGGNGMVLGIRDNIRNRSDNENNIEITGLSQAVGKKGELLSGENCISYLFPFLEKVSSALGGIRRNILLVEVIKGGSTENTLTVRLRTREGVKIYVQNPSALTLEKAEAAVNKYLSLSEDVQRLTGAIAVFDKDGEVLASYSETDGFED